MDRSDASWFINTCQPLPLASAPFFRSKGPITTYNLHQTMMMLRTVEFFSYCLTKIHENMKSKNMSFCNLIAENVVDELAMSKMLNSIRSVLTFARNMAAVVFHSRLLLFSLVAGTPHMKHIIRTNELWLLQDEQNQLPSGLGRDGGFCWMLLGMDDLV